MMPYDSNESGVFTLIHLYADIEHATGAGMLYRKRRGFQIGGYFLHFRRRYARDDFELFGRIARNYTRRRGAGYAFHSAGIGNDDALYVFKDITAYRNFRALGNFSQSVAGESRRVCYGDWLGTAHCGQQFFAENIYEIPI